MISAASWRVKDVGPLLRDWFSGSHDGLMAAASMPESEPPAGVLRGSTQHLLFLTLTVSIDYQRDASQLWDAARQTIIDPSTAWLFQTRTVASKSPEEVQAAMRVHRLSRKHEKDSLIWSTICTSLAELFDSDPAILFRKCDNDAMTLYCEMRNVYHKRFPYLAGSTGSSKILAVWIRMLHDEAGVNLSHLDRVPLPVDVHTARASLTTGVVCGSYDGSVVDLSTYVRDAWREGCEGTDLYPLQLDEALWNLSRFGCRDREDGSCPHSGDCKVYKSGLCVIKGRIEVSGEAVHFDTPCGERA